MPSRSTRLSGSAIAIRLARLVPLTRLCWETQACSVPAVWAPTVPLAGLRLAAVWNRWTELFVPGPKLPSAPVGMPTSVNQF